MSEQIRITMLEVSASSAQIRALNTALDDVLNSITSIMNEVNSVWDSSGSREIAARYKSFASRYVKESETIESYCRFLDYTVASYDSLESTITSNAQGFN